MKAVKNVDGSEFRQDLVSNDWILIAARRARRPHKEEKRKRLESSKKSCPFDNLRDEPLLWLPSPSRSLFKDWWVQIIPNKFPALEPHKTCPVAEPTGPYKRMRGVGFHEIIVSRDHNRRISEMTLNEAEILLYAYQERWRTLAREECVRYILIFHNQGPRAGASVFHPHSQLVALPIIPPDVAKSLDGSRLYFARHKKCVHCAMLSWERKNKTRVIYENKNFIAFEPFASRVSYETRIFPKRHAGNFEDLDKKERMSLAEALIVSLKKLKSVLSDPDYNFFIHTAPAKDGADGYYHWHIEILPKTSIWAGLELGTGIEVVAVSPEDAAKELKKR